MVDAIFYAGTKNASSWAMRAWLALRAADFQFREEVVDIRRPQRFSNLERIASLSPSATVPLLRIGDRTIFDSLAIMEFANDVSGGGLLPADAIDRATARSYIAWQHAGLSQICPRISFESAFYPFKRPLSAREVEQCSRLFDPLEQIVRRSAGDFLFGPIGLVDFALTPAVVRLTRHSIDLGSWPLVEQWTKRLLAHSLVDEWMEEADRLPHIWFDDYLHPDLPLPGVERQREDWDVEQRTNLGC